MRKATLQKLTENSEQQMQAIAAELAGALREVGEASEKLLTLERYLSDYESRMERDLGAGLSATRSRNYQNFMDQLSAAVNLQRHRLVGYRQQVQALQSRWLDARRRSLTFETLVVRAETEERRAELRKMQRDLDELSRRAASVSFEYGCPA